MNLSRTEMDDHIKAGRATPWTQPLAGAVPTAAHLDGTWYVVIEGTDHYQPAPPPLAAVLTEAHAMLTIADRAVATAEANSRSS